MPRIAKWGNSLSVRIPTSIAQNLQLTNGEECYLRLLDSGDILIRLARLKPGASVIEASDSVRQISKSQKPERW